MPATAQATRPMTAMAATAASKWTPGPRWRVTAPAPLGVGRVGQIRHSSAGSPWGQVGATRRSYVAAELPQGRASE
jgi:hypothetical protein